jgi:broad specificity phosphatase PhoE
MSETASSSAASSNPVGLAPPTRLVLVRHGESDVTVRRVVGGPRTCSGLSELGRRQAASLRDRWASHPIGADVLYSSAYPRAVETAEILAPALGTEVRVEDGLGEHDPGPECDGLGFAAFVERFGTPDWESDPYGITFPGGETIAGFQYRVGSTIRAVVDRHPGATVVAVCHGGVVAAVFRLALRAVTTGVFELHTSNTSITELVHVSPGRWRLLRYNDTAHLVGLPSETPRDPV